MNEGLACLVMPMFMSFKPDIQISRAMLESHQEMGCESRQEQGSYIGSQQLHGGLLTFVPLNDMCSRKCAAPLLSGVSYLLPASIQTPTVAVSANGVVSEATRMPLGRVVTCNANDRQLALLRHTGARDEVREALLLDNLL